MQSTRVKRLLPLWGLLMFSLALVALHHTLRQVHYHDIRQAIHNVDPRTLLGAGLVTACAYLILTWYDVLALAYMHKKQPYRRIAFASFLGWALSNSVGYSILSGGAVRYRLYSKWGLNTIEIAHVVAFCTFTSVLGAVGMAGAGLVLDATPAAASVALPTNVARIAGTCCILVTIAYAIWGGAFFRMRNDTSLFHGVPRFGMRLAQVTVGCLDLVTTALVLYVLLPRTADISAPAFVGFFVIGISLGIVSQVPGGIGVFDASLLYLLKPYADPHQLVVALILYRFLYYVVPLGIALTLVTIYETRGILRPVSRGLGRWFVPALPDALSVAVAVCGIVLLISGATPELPARMHLLRDLLPLPVVEISHLGASIVGFLLIVLATAIHQRVDAAYFLACGLLAAGAVFALLKGLDYEEAAALSFMLIVFLPSRRQFTRHASVLRPRLSPMWIVTILAPILGFIWLGMFSHKHIEYRNSLWWRFAYEGDAPRFLRAAVGIVTVSIGLSFALLLKPISKAVRLPSRDDLDRIKSILEESRQTHGNLALLGDKSILFDESRTGFIMYGTQGGTCISMGDPVGSDDVQEELVWDFKALCNETGNRPVFYQVTPAHLPKYVDAGFQLLKLGECGRVNLTSFSLAGGAHKEERRTLKHIEQEGYTFEILPAGEVDRHMDRLRAVSDNWLASKNTAEKGFSLGFFKEDYLRNYPMAVIRNHEGILAFANIWASADRHELTIDLMRYTDSSPRGVMDYLFVNLMLWGQEQGYQWFDIGMAPLAGLQNRPMAPFWNQIGGLVFRHGEHFYNFEGLRRYKSKFKPVWEPRYLASPGGLSVPFIFTDLSVLIAGGVTRVATKR